MKRYFLLLFILLNVLNAQAEQDFVASDIRVEGLQRISAGSVFSVLPINVGDNIDDLSIRNGIRSLFRTGNFNNVVIGRDGTVLVVTVEERPSISEINIEGNKAIESEALIDGLKGAGLSEGEVFKRSTLEGMQAVLTQQYVSQGRYDAGIDTDVELLPRNRVAVNIIIDEGTTAAIKHINIVGNAAYSDEDLEDLFELNKTGWLSWLSGNDKYAREKLSGDLDTLRDYYLDRGYITFNIDSSQVSVTPDREAVYITINITEGDKYTVGDVDLSGDIVLSEDALRPLIFIKTGQTFSQALVTSSEEWLGKRLGNEGYNFAKVSGIPDIDDETKTVNLKFFVDPGKRTYVNRIKFEGNTRTADEVLRREMRQMEAAPASSASIEHSRIRLERLGYFKEAQVETQEVPGTDDLIDLTYTVEEQSSGSIGASVGFSQDSGIIFGANIQQNNFLGTGRQIGIGLNKSDYLTNVNFSFVNPFYTKDGVSRGFSVYYRETDLEEINVSSYTTNTLGTTLNFGYPIGDTARLGFSFGYANTEITAGVGAVQEIKASPRLFDVITVNGADWFTEYYEAGDGTVADTLIPLLDDNGNVLAPEVLSPNSELGFLDKNGDTFNDFTVTTTWSDSTLNRGILATRGMAQSLSLQLTIPGSDLEYFKLIYKGQLFIPITNSFTLRLRTELGYGDGLRGGDDLPFFNNFFAGGFGSVRGFKSNTLGPRSTSATRYRTGAATIAIEEGDIRCPTATAGVCDNDSSLLVGDLDSDLKSSYVIDPSTGLISTFAADSDPDPFGGNVLIEAGAELLFPLPFIKDQRSLRTAFFIDAGNVFSSNCGSTQLNCFEPDVDELRYSAGVGLTWISGFGPLTFSLAKPLNEGEEDETEIFQFSLGRSF